MKQARAFLSRVLIIGGALYLIGCAGTLKATGGIDTELLGVHIKLTGLTKPYLVAVTMIFAGVLLSFDTFAGLLRPVLERTARARRRTRVVLVALVVIGFGAWMSAQKLRQYHRLQTTCFDHGLEANVSWQVVHGHGFYSSPQGINYLGDHFAPIHAATGLLLLVWPDAAALLVLQSVVLAVGGWGVYLLGRRVARDWRVALLLAALFLANPYLHMANRFDFHEVTLALGVWPWLLLAMERRKWIAFAALAVLGAAMQDTVVLALAGLGAAMLLKPRRRRAGAFPVPSAPPAGQTGSVRGSSGAGREPSPQPSPKGRGSQGPPHPDPLPPSESGERGPERRPSVSRTRRAGAVLFVLAAALFVVEIKVLVPMFLQGGESKHVARYAHFGSNLNEVARNVATDPLLLWRHTFADPEKLQALGRLFRTWGFLPLLGGWALLPAIPPILWNMASAHEPQWAFAQHYTANILGFLALATAYGAARLQRLLARRWSAEASRALVCLVMAYLVLIGLPAVRSYVADDPHPAHVAEFHRIKGQVDPTERIMASTALVPHLALRRHIFMFDYEYLTVGDSVSRKAPDRIVLDVSPSANHWPFPVRGDYDTAIQALLGRKDYGVTHDQDGILILRQGAPARPNRAVARRLARESRSRTRRR